MDPRRASAARALSLGRGAPLARDGLEPVHDLVARHCREAPGMPAVSSGGEEISYGELGRRSDAVAARLARAGAGRGRCVGVLVEPSIEMVAAVLGVLKSGAAYIPIELSEPDARIAEILRSTGAAAVVVGAEGAARLAGRGLALVPADPEEAAPVAPVAVELADAAYVIHTSGSTGEPKGVVVAHGQLAASTRARTSVYPGRAVFLLVSPLAFDSSVAGLWGTLATGGRLVVAQASEVTDPDRLVELVERERVTRMLAIPSLYDHLLRAAERRGPRRLRSLETAIVAGEALPEAVVERHFAVCPPGTALVNEYGPTEATVWASYHRFEVPGPVSVGRPVPGVDLYVLDASLRPVPLEAEGELFVGGAGVARGYLGRAGATAAAFLPDPFAEEPGRRMYRTGDVARWSAAGTLELLGRRDHQVKIRGRRVELGAVEAALRRAPAVRDAVVLPDEHRTTLVGFVVADEDGDADAIRRAAAEVLPAATVPARIHLLESFPRTTTGKIDRNALRAAVETEPAPPAPAEDDSHLPVLAAWAEVLELRHIAADADFFDIGGHSLAVFQLQDALERHTGTRPSVVDLFRHTTVAQQARLLDPARVSGR